MHIPLKANYQLQKSLDNLIHNLNPGMRSKPKHSPQPFEQSEYDTNARIQKQKTKRFWRNLKHGFIFIQRKFMDSCQA